MIPPIVWSFLLFALGLILLLLEVFVPSAGILGFLSVTSVIAAIVLAFVYYDLWVGTSFLVVAVLGMPIALAVLMKWWPYTPIGRRILNLPPPDREDPSRDSWTVDPHADLLGKRGTARSLMLPSGSIIVDGHAYDAVSQGMVIEAGQTVEIIETKGNRIVVRPAPEAAQPARRDEGADDVLSRPVDELGLDALEDPLG